MPLTLHIGVHKTATTHLQKSLGLAAERLRDAGIFYAGPDELRGDAFPLVAALNAKGQGGAFTKAVGQVMAQAVQDYPRQLLSDENILGGTNRHGMFDKQGRVYPQAAPRLARAVKVLGDRPVTVALSVRNPAEFNVSAFSLQITRGRELDIRDYLMGRDPAALSWSNLATRLLAVAGVTRLIVWRYEDYGKLRSQLLTRLLGADLADQIPEPPPANVGLTAAAYDWLVARAMEDDDADLRILVREAWRLFPKSAGHPGLHPLTEDEYARAGAGYAEDVAALRNLPGVEFLTP